MAMPHLHFVIQCADTPDAAGVMNVRYRHLRGGYGLSDYTTDKRGYRDKLEFAMSGGLVHEAVRDNNREQLILLLEQRPSESNRADVNGTTPLILAAQLDKTALVKILLSRGADPTAQEKFEVGGKSAIHYSAINNNREVAAEVLREGGQVNAQDQLGRTPLHLACRHGNSDIVSILLSKGADPNKRDNSGFTPSYWAALEGHHNCLEHLPPPQYYGSKQIADFQVVTMDVLNLTPKPAQKSGRKKERKK